MPVVRAMAIIPHTLGNPADAVTNTFHFDVSDAGGTSTGDIAAGLDTLYATARDAFGSSADLLEARYKMYDLTDSEPRAPIYDEAAGIGLAAGGGESLPPELSICLSFQGARISGLAQSRRRGRVYLGPIGIGSSVDGVPSPSTCGLLMDAGIALLAASTATATYTWVVWSPTTQTAIAVTDGWVDNAYDVQRRRGFVPTLRNTWP